jgi:ATP-binding cassette subfamily F protein uup
MEQRIMEAEELLSAKQTALDEASQSGDAARAKEAYDAMLAAQEEVDRLYARWAELEAKQT